MADHPVKVPPELAEQLWSESADKPSQCNTFRAHVFAQKIAEWAADQELEACCKWLGGSGYAGTGSVLRTARRPKPPTLAEQATTALHAIASGANDAREQCQDIATLTAALTRLAELEANQ